SPLVADAPASMAFHVGSVGCKPPAAPELVCEEPEPPRPVTPAATSEASRATAASAKTRRRFGMRNVQRGSSGLSEATRSRSAAEATGRDARSSSAIWSKSPTSSSGDTGAHLLLQLLQGTAEARRARRRADP